MADAWLGRVSGVVERILASCHQRLVRLECSVEVEPLVGAG